MERVRAHRDLLEQGLGTGRQLRRLRSAPARPHPHERRGEDPLAFLEASSAAERDEVSEDPLAGLFEDPSPKARAPGQEPTTIKLGLDDLRLD